MQWCQKFHLWVFAVLVAKEVDVKLDVLSDGLSHYQVPYVLSNLANHIIDVKSCGGGFSENSLLLGVQTQSVLATIYFFISVSDQG